MSFPRYESYKDSGVEWLGEVPAHWSVKRLRFVAQLNPSKSETAKLDRETEVSFLPMEAVGDNGSLNLERTRQIGEVETGYTYFREGDVTVAKITPCFENGKGAVMRGLLGGIGFGTTELIVARPLISEAFSEYLHWLFISAQFRKLGESSMYGAGGQKRVPDEFVRNFATAFPAVSEQHTISTFLDRETAKIDALIAEQQRLIELLKEKRQAVISHAVTKGLNPDAPMKDSGIEWLGEVPEYWEVKRLKHIKALSPNSFVDGPFGSNLKSEHFIDDGDVYVIESNFATQGRLEPSELKTISREHFETIRRSETKAGDIIVAKIGAQFGKATILPNIDKLAVVSGNSMKLTVNNDVCNTIWAYWQLFNLKANGEIDILVNGSAQPALSLGAMNELVFLLPSADEQEEIIACLDRETVKLDALTTEAQRVITLLQERRTALISAAVTGKIDVRSSLSTQENPPCR